MLDPWVGFALRLLFLAFINLCPRDIYFRVVRHNVVVLDGGEESSFCCVLVSVGVGVVVDDAVYVLYASVVDDVVEDLSDVVVEVCLFSMMFFCICDDALLGDVVVVVLVLCDLSLG